MKKLLTYFLILFLVTIFSSLALAAGTVTQSVKAGGPYGNKIIFTFLCTGDAAAGTVPDTDFSHSKLPKAYLYEIETIPGTGGAQPSAYTVDVQNSDGTSIASGGLSARSATANERERIEAGPHMAADDTLTLITGNLGNSDTATIILYFMY